MLALPLAVGMMIFALTLYLAKLEINLFNVIAVPSIIGIGIDNSVHIYHRYRREGLGSVIFVLRRTGFAALLASLTTAVGFGSSLISHHAGLRSLGMVAIIGIGATLIAAVVFFPSVLVLIERLRGKTGTGTVTEPSC